MVVIVGNGKSRVGKDWQNRGIIRHAREFWVCNWAFREEFFKPIDRVGTVHPEVVTEAVQRRKENNLSYEIWSKPELGSKVEGIDRFFDLKEGWSTGNMMIGQALHEGYENIVLVGFDMGGPDIYQVNDRPGDNFKKQFGIIRKRWPDASIVRIT